MLPDNGEDKNTDLKEITSALVKIKGEIEGLEEKISPILKDLSSFSEESLKKRMANYLSLCDKIESIQGALKPINQVESELENLNASMNQSGITSCPYC